MPELHEERLVQPELSVHGGELGPVDPPAVVASEDQQRDIPGDDAHDHEHHGGDAEQRGDDEEETRGQIRAHARPRPAQSSDSQTSWSFWFV